MMRVFKNADTKYIEKLLTEMETDKDNTYEIDIAEYRENAEIETITINARRIKDCNF